MTERQQPPAGGDGAPTDGSKDASTEHTEHDIAQDEHDDPESSEHESGADAEVNASEEEGEQEEGPEEGGSDETDYLTVDDDDLITVMVDGEEQEVSIGQLKKAHSGEGAIEKRLQEATEARKKALTEHQRGAERLAADEKALSEALSSLDDTVFKGVIPPPDENLKNSNPQQYIRHYEAYKQDQQRVADAKKAVEDKRAEIEKQRRERHEEMAKQAAQTIVKEIPELGDSGKAQQTYAQLAETAMSYGYSQEEINQAVDPRMFMLVRDAMRYRQMLGGDATASQVKERQAADKKKKVRRLKSGNTSAKSRASQNDQKRKQAADKARQSGKPDDVAKFMSYKRG